MFDKINENNNIYFLLRFGLANAINHYFRLKINFECGEYFNLK